MRTSCACPDRSAIRIAAFDAYACRVCKRWQESACTDATCTFCAKRPPDASGCDWEDPHNTIPQS